MKTKSSLRDFSLIIWTMQRQGHIRRKSPKTSVYAK
ncbi:hypothetical protein KP509_25G021600 [Ceratopteris richardii]|uniref:Uncharacterized protein n=1 Tax=Ceratopteris richardii TaxID=49495 RepID=A0A8T2RNF7_CERRI|nr:hypothetical protein KP509_25G021600 [Ceratopteris richardii]